MSGYDELYPHTTEEDLLAIMDGVELGSTSSIQPISGWKMRGASRRDHRSPVGDGGTPRERLLLQKYLVAGEVPTNRGFALSIRQQVEGSLKRLQTDYIDIYQMHHIDRNTPWEETWQAMETLVQQGKILYAGSSNFAGWHIAKAQEAAKARHFMGLVSEQSLYNLKDRMIELEVLPACKDYGLGVIPWSPLAGGILGACRDQEGRRASDERQRDIKPRPNLKLRKNSVNRWAGIRRVRCPGC
jgi:aryl-alcohol dehydrogenase-like predicted oxidoreductase